MLSISSLFNNGIKKISLYFENEGNVVFLSQMWRDQHREAHWVVMPCHRTVKYASVYLSINNILFTCPIRGGLHQYGPNHGFEHCVFF